MIGPAEIALTRMFFSPRSQARYLTDESSAAYFVSDMARGVTGEIFHVDAGYHVVGMKNPEAPDLSLDKV